MRFKYTEMDKTGREIQGIVTASSQKEALEMLHSADRSILSISVANELFSREIRFTNKNQLLLNFTESLYNMLSSGISLAPALEFMVSEEKDPKLRNTISSIIVKLKKGTSLHESLSTFDIFPPIYTSMIKAGEASGKLKTVLQQLLTHFQKKMEMDEKVISSLYYPVFLVTLSLLALSYLVFFVLPQFFQIFEGLNAKLPWSTLLIMNTVNFVRDHIIIMAILVVGAIIAVQRTLKSEKGRMLFEKTLLSVPKIGETYRLSLNTLLFKPLDLLLKNRVNLLLSLQILRGSTRSPMLIQSIDSIERSIKSGKTISDGLAGNTLFSVSTLQMITVGERSGKLAEVIENINTSCTAKFESEMRRMIVLIEPVLILVIGLVIGFVVISALLPVYTMSTIIQ